MSGWFWALGVAIFVNYAVAIYRQGLKCPVRDISTVLRSFLHEIPRSGKSAVSNVCISDITARMCRISRACAP